jgi:hypothetical protein
MEKPVTLFGRIAFLHMALVVAISAAKNQQQIPRLGLKPSLGMTDRIVHPLKLMA